MASSKVIGVAFLVLFSVDLCFAARSLQVVGKGGGGGSNGGGSGYGSGSGSGHGGGEGGYKP
ncbi:hypothetical protein ACSBR1_027401 [Camellia fascicularis]